MRTKITIVFETQIRCGLMLKKKGSHLRGTQGKHAWCGFDWIALAAGNPPYDRTPAPISYGRGDTYHFHHIFGGVPCG
jgi:hypothetical protein